MLGIGETSKPYIYTKRLFIKGLAQITKKKKIITKQWSKAMYFTQIYIRKLCWYTNYV